MTQGLSRTSALLATLGVAMALLLAALDQTVVGVAMPRIVSELHGLQYYAWVTTAYLITSTALVPVAGKLGDMFGRKPFLLAGMVGFIAASALCGTSFNMASLWRSAPCRVFSAGCFSRRHSRCWPTSSRRSSAPA